MNKRQKQDAQDVCRLICYQCSMEILAPGVRLAEAERLPDADSRQFLQTPENPTTSGRQLRYPAHWILPNAPSPAPLDAQWAQSCSFRSLLLAVAAVHRTTAPARLQSDLTKRVLTIFCTSFSQVPCPITPPQHVRSDRVNMLIHTNLSFELASRGAVVGPHVDQRHHLQQVSIRRQNSTGGIWQKVHLMLRLYSGH